MKGFILNLCLICFFINVFGQNKTNNRADSIKYSIIRDLPTDIPHHKFLSVIDGRNHYGFSIKKINPTDIFEVNLLKGDEAKDKYGELGKNGVVIISTKRYAIDKYQFKLASLSKEYLEYLNQNSNDDSNLFFVINGIVLKGTKYDTQKELYDVSDKIKTVDFIEKYSKKFNTDNPKPTIIITTEK